MIFRWLLIMLIVVPIIEIWGLLQVGEWVGAWPTVLAVLATGVIGGYLAKNQGLQTWRLIQVQIEQRQMPGEALLDGVCILVGGLMLITPGFFTDSIGFLLLLPFPRGVVKIGLKRAFYKRIQKGPSITIHR